MKKNNTIVLVVCLITILSFNMSSAKALDKNEDLQVYNVRDKQDGIITSDILFDFYEENNMKLKSLLDPRKNKEEVIEVSTVEEVEVEEDYVEPTTYVSPKVETKVEEVYEPVVQEPEPEPVYVEANGDVASFATQFVGNPYVYGGTSLTNGADCSGFVMSVYANFGISLPRTASAQSTVGYAVSQDQIQPGDIISYGYNGVVSHSAIYVGNGTIVHASTPSLGIRLDNMYIMPIVTIRRVG